VCQDIAQLGSEHVEKGDRDSVFGGDGNFLTTREIQAIALTLCYLQEIRALSWPSIAGEWIEAHQATATTGAALLVFVFAVVVLK
jgi:hypothetical protein